MYKVKHLKLITALFGLMLSVAHAASIDLALEIDFGEFSDGVLIGEISTVTFTVSHLGPDVVDLNQVRFVGSYNYETSEANPFQFFQSFTSEDSECNLSQPMIDPRPPVNNYANIYFGSINKILSPFSAVSCEYRFTNGELGLYDTLWELTVKLGDVDPDLSNNAIQFTFGPQPMLVPLSKTAVVLLAFFILILASSKRVRYFLILK